MKRLIFLVMLSVTANPYRWPIIRVVDGDTIEVAAKWLPIELGKTIKIRLDGVDSPESGGNAKCTKEAELAKQAKEYVQKTVSTSRKHSIIIRAWDKYGGRVLGDVILDGKSLKDQMITSGFAKPYAGGKKASWCE